MVGTPDAVYGEAVSAFVVFRDAGSGAAAREALSQHCRRLLSPAKVPAHIVLVDELPRNAGGKVLRKELQQRFTEDGKGSA